jgi:hypothetical protein
MVELISSKSLVGMLPLLKFRVPDTDTLFAPCAPREDSALGGQPPVWDKIKVDLEICGHCGGSFASLSPPGLGNDFAGFK